MCELLIEEGADVDATDKAGRTPLMDAVICENIQVALLPIRHGADVDVEDKEGYTVLWVGGTAASHDLRPLWLMLQRLCLKNECAEIVRYEIMIKFCDTY